MDTISKNIFAEAVNTKKQNKDYTMTAKIVPFGKISKNGVMYKKESVINTCEKLIGKPVLFNHKADEGLPRGEWIASEIKDDGLYGTAKIYNTGYNKDLIEYLSHASNPNVSLKIIGDAVKKFDESTGKQYSIATISDWLEASIVNIPGFEEAKVLSFEYFIAESLGLGIQKNEGGIRVASDFKEVFEKLDKHEILLEKVISLMETMQVKADEVKSEAVAEPKTEEVKEEAKAEDKKEDESKEDKKESETKEEVKEESKVEDKKEDESKEDKKETDINKESKTEPKTDEVKEEAKVDDKKEEITSKEEVRTIDQRDNEPDVQKPEDNKSTADVKKISDKEELDLPKKPEVVKQEAAKVKTLDESFSASDEKTIWREMLTRHFGNKF
jgi:DNA polymerase III gamma/tau subunit